MESQKNNFKQEWDSDRQKRTERISADQAWESTAVKMRTMLHGLTH